MTDEQPIKRRPGRPRTRTAPVERPPQHIDVADSRPDIHPPIHERKRTRKRQHSALDRDDPFYVNLEAVPSDISVEWKRWSNVGEENPFYIAHLREQGWEPVNPKEHPDWVPVPPDYKDNVIIKSGLILMERPRELTEEARREMRQLSRRQIIEAEQRLGMTQKGELARQAPQVVKEIGRMVQTVEE